MQLINKSRFRIAFTLVPIAIMTTLVIGVGLAGYLKLASQQYIYTNRHLAWNTAMATVDAGCEEAMVQLNNPESWSSNSWALHNNAYKKRRAINNGYYISSISNVNPPVIYVTGYAPSPLATNYISRTVKIDVETVGLFAKGMVAKGNIQLNGNNIRTDSFDSSNPTHSTAGQYDPAKAKDNGDVATNSGLVNSLALGNADILGKISTGPGGSVTIGHNGAVGNTAWHTNGNTGIQTGYSSSDMNVAFPDVEIPYSSTQLPVAGTITNGTTITPYTYILSTGDYTLTSLNLSGSGSVFVSGDARLHVTSSFSMSGHSQIVIATNATLQLYVGATSASIAGNGIMNSSGNATNFFYWGLPSNTALSLSGNAAFTGVIYAPNANFSLNGGGNSTYDFTGASITSTVNMNGHFNFHYDENLANSGPQSDWLITSWEEI